MIKTIENKIKTFQNHINFQEILWIIISETIKNLLTPNNQALMNMIDRIPIKQAVKYYKKSLIFLQKR